MSWIAKSNFFLCTKSGVKYKKYVWKIYAQAQVSYVQVCHANPAERSRFIRCIYNLLNSSSPAVRYEAAGTLVTLSSAPTAVKVHLHSIDYWLG